MDQELREIASLLQKHAFAHAEERLRKLLTEFPKHAHVHRMQALLASGRGRNAEALEHMICASSLTGTR